MDWPFISSETSLAILSALAGFALSIASTLLVRWFSGRQAREKTEEVEFDRAITSDDLSILGQYLNTRLGTVPVSTFLRDATANARINQYVARLADLVKPSESATSEGQQSASATPAFDGELFEAPIDVYPDDPEAVTEAIQNLRNGEVWTALARLRRDLERRIRSLSVGSAPSRGPVYKYIQDPRLASETKQFWDIASKAIHGDEVSMQEAFYAVKLAREIYREMERIPGPPQK